MMTKGMPSSARRHRRDRIIACDVSVDDVDLPSLRKLRDRRAVDVIDRAANRKLDDVVSGGRNESSLRSRCTRCETDINFMTAVVKPADEIDDVTLAATEVSC